MKTLLKLTLAITAAATLGSASLFASPANWPPTSPSNTAVRTLAMPMNMNCKTMTIQGNAKQGGQQVVSCEHFGSVRPDDCRRACASK